MSAALVLLSFLLGFFLVGLLLASLTKWSVWIAAIATSVAAVIAGAIFDPIHLELGNALFGFVAALGGAAVGAHIRRKRTA